MSEQTASPAPSGFHLSNQVYDLLKWIAQILLPALGTAYYGLAQIWGLPAAEQVVGTIVVIDTLLGVLLGLSSTQYNKQGADGHFSLAPDPDDPNVAVFQMKVDGDAASLVGKRFLTLKAK